MKLASLFLLSLSVTTLFAEETRPNILYIMTDDHAAHATSIYGSKVNKTPNLDRLGKAGLVFDNAFVTNSICTPSRATLLTGKYSHKNGTPVFNRFDGEQPTVAKMMQKAGYYTGMFGKWHLGSDPTGFDQWEILPGQGNYDDPVLYNAEKVNTYTGKYATHVITDLSLSFLDKRPKDKPFLLFCHHKAPHRAWMPEQKYREQFAKEKIAEPATLMDDYEGRGTALHENKQSVARDFTNHDLKVPIPADKAGFNKQAWLRERPTELTIDGATLTGEALVKWKYQRYMQDYLACLQSVDDSVGQILDYLKKNGLEENTLVVYTSDNGFFLGDHGLYDKRYMYEESLRIPLLIKWPTSIQPDQRSTAIALNVDFAPTFLAAAGLPIPADMQGRSLLPVFKNPKTTEWRQSMYYRYYHDPGDHNTPAHLGIRTLTHKLIHYWKQDEWEMYDLTNDAGEMKNLANDPAHAAKLAELKAELAKLKKELDDKDEFSTSLPLGTVDGGIQARKKAVELKKGA